VSYASGLQERAVGVATGTANLAASFSDAHGNLATSSAALNVSSATLNGISIAPGNAGVTLGGGHQFVATGTFTDGTQQDLTLTADWSVTNSSIATVTPSVSLQPAGLTNQYRGYSELSERVRFVIGESRSVGKNRHLPRRYCRSPQ